MKDATHRLFRRWLTAERRDATAAAERALAALFTRLPEARPRPGFAERVVAAAGLRETLAPRPVFGVPGRALVAACLLLTGLAVAYLPALAAFVADHVTLADAVSLVVGSVTRAVDFLALAVTIGEILVTLYEALLRVVLSPPVAVAGLAALVVSTLTLCWLAQLLAPRRNAEYVSVQ